MEDLAFLFKPSARRQADLDKFLSDVQNTESGIYHQWLTPEQYAERFAISEADMNEITGWLTAQGFQISYRARSRTWVAFKGTAAQAQAAFRTPIHRYIVNGEEHYANLADPSIPAALRDVVSSIRGLHDLRLKPGYRRMSTSGSARPAFDNGCGIHFMAPADFAAIYDLNPLYSAGVDGTGQKLAIVGQSGILLSDVAAFRTAFNLPQNTPRVVLYGLDPGVTSSDQLEAELDVEWSGAVARNATIVYVYSTDVFTSLTYAIDQNIAPVINMSYGACESSNIGVLGGYRTLAQQGAAQGISWVASSGDAGAADCDNTLSTIATQGLDVDFPADIPEVTGVGGTEFVEAGSDYWNSSIGTKLGNSGRLHPGKSMERHLYRQSIESQWRRRQLLVSCDAQPNRSGISE